VVFKDDTIAWAQVYLCDWHKLAFYLARAVGELELCHVPKARCLAPTGV
jgi:hypothetical protein